MALNIPVNMMATTTPPVLTSASKVAIAGATDTAAIKPVLSSANAQGTAPGGSGMSSGRKAQQALTQHQHITHKQHDAPYKAEPKSVVTAQIPTAPEPAKSDALQPVRLPAVHLPRQSELDRFAPPNPLPTAPILQLAAAYAALTLPED